MRYSKLNIYEMFYLPSHFAGAGLYQDLKRLLLDFDWLQAKLVHTNPEMLISDIALLEGNEIFDMLGSAIRRSSHILSNFPYQLAGQLIGRLDADRNESISKLLLGAQSFYQGPKILPMHTGFIGSTDLLFKTILVPIIDNDAMHSAHVTVVAPNDKIAATGAWGSILVWNLSTAEIVRQFKIEKHGRVDDLMFTPSSKYLLTKELTRVRLIDIENLEQIWSSSNYLDFPLAVSPNSATAVKLRDDFSVWICSLITRKALRWLDGPFDPLSSLYAAIDPTSRYVAIVYQPKNYKWAVVSCFNFATGTLVWKRNLQPLKFKCTTTFSHDGSQLIVAGLKSMAVLDSKDGKTIAKWSHDHSFLCLALSPIADCIFLGSNFSSVQMFELASGKLIATWDHLQCNFVKASNNGRFLYVTKNCDRAVRVLNLDSVLRRRIGTSKKSSYREVREGNPKNSAVAPLTFRGHRVLAISKNGSLVLTCDKYSYDMVIWNKKTGKILKKRTDYSGYRKGPAFFSYDCTSVLYITDDMKNGYLPPMLERWEFLSDNVIKMYTKHDNQGYSCLACTPDIELAVIGGPDNFVSAYDTQTGTELWSHALHSSHVTALAITPNGRWAVSGGADHWVRLWDVTAGTVKCEFALEATVRECLISECGKEISVRDDFDLWHELSAIHYG